MKTLQLDEINARKIYPYAPQELKTILENSFGGKSFFTPVNIIQRIISFEAACEDQGKDPNAKKYTKGKPHNIARRKLELITKSLRQDVILSYADGDQKKWYPVFVWDEKVSGFRFRAALYDYSITHSTGGSRLCVDTQEKAILLGTNPEFIELYNQFLK